jgi:hypothetical protein
VSQSGGTLASGDVSVCYIDGSDAGTTAGDVGDVVRVSINYDHDLDLGSGFLTTAFGVDPFTWNMSPTAEGQLLKPVVGGTKC